MKGIVVYNDGDLPRLVWETVSDVHPGPQEVLVNVRATAVNRADLLQARGGYPPPEGASPLLGLEMAGEIAAVGEAVTGRRVGERVCALLPGGGYAEQVVVHEAMLLPIPDEWTFGQAAAVPEVWLTAFVNLFIEANLRAGEIALIHAGGSGVGTAAIQLVREAKATPFITAGTEEKLQFGRQLGAQLAVNYKTDDFSEHVLVQTNGRGVDVILDPVGADYLMKDLHSLAPGGRLVHIGLLSGAETTIDLRLLIGKSLRLIGSRLRPRPLTEKIEITRRFERQFWPLLANGTMEPIIDTVFPLPEAQEAHAYVRQNKNIGKVILSLDL